MKKIKSVYQRMNNDKKLFFLGYGVLYVTEMRRVKNLTRTPELRIKSKELAFTWYNLFKKYGLIPNKNKGIHQKDGIFTFNCNALSIYYLLNIVKRLPDKDMDYHLRKRISNIIYTDSNPINKNRIKILKALYKNSLTTNELARRINYNPGKMFKLHLDALQNLGFLQRKRIGTQTLINFLTNKGKIFIKDFISEIENVPQSSLYDKCFTSKQLAADMLLIISELEMGGIIERQPYLEMTSYDFVKFVFDVCKKWNWTNQRNISARFRTNYKPTYLFRLNSSGTKEIYNLAGSCADTDKNIAYKHISSLRKPGRHGRIGETKKQILRFIRNNVNTSKQIAIELNIGVQNIQRQLSNLVKEGMLTREKIGTGYIYKTNVAN